MTSLDPQLSLQPSPPMASASELQHSEAPTSEPDVLQPIPFCPDDSALRPNAPSGTDLQIWFANLSQGKQVLALLIVGLFLVALLGVLLQLLALAIQLVAVGLVAVLVFKFLISPSRT